MTYCKNYAGKTGSELDALIAEELKGAGIVIETLPEVVRKHMGEVQTITMGNLWGWTFKRFWRYWVCEGPGIPVEHALELHRLHGHAVRVDGHAGAPNPLERFNGLGVGIYHVDTLDGLKALADTINRVVAESKLPVCKREVAQPSISVARQSKQIAIFDGLNCIHGFDSYEIETWAVEQAREWLAQNCVIPEGVQIEIVYPVLNRVVYT